jgi:nitrilase
MKIALWQTVGLAGDVAGNLAALEPMAEAAAAAGAALLLCPECWLCGYNIGAEVLALAELRDGASAKRIAQIAAAHHIAIVYGYAERDPGGAIYNSVQVIDRDGRPASHYRKTHLFGAAEKAIYRVGERLEPPFELGGWKIGLLICFDVEYPEPARALALMGAQLLLVPTALTDEFANVPELLVPARAAENQIYVAYCNHAGMENGMSFLGGSRLVGRDGRFIVAAGAGEALILGELSNSSPVASGYPYLCERRPELYGLITKSG